VNIKTTILKLTTGGKDIQNDDLVERAASVIIDGGLVAFPTETVYGLGADAFNREAVKKVFRAKGRPSDNPLIVHIADINNLYEIGKNISPLAIKLAETFWPGPLTLVVEHSGVLPNIVTANLKTVAVRTPNHPVALALIRKAGRGIVGPSANLSGKPSPTTAQHVYDDLNGLVDIILDAGPTAVGIESTVLDVTSKQPVILRLGGLTREEIQRISGTVQATRDIDRLKHSPGTRHRHYAPRAKVELLDEGNTEQCLQLIEAYSQEGKTIGCIVHSSQMLSSRLTKHIHIIHIKNEDYARNIFDALRGLDQKNVGVILVESISETGIGEAVMDRLRKAASGK
jgi:L-threonylcarbamoyladenylate synthase